MKTFNLFLTLFFTFTVFSKLMASSMLPERFPASLVPNFNSGRIEENKCQIMPKDDYLNLESFFKLELNTKNYCSLPLKRLDYAEFKPLTKGVWP